MEDAAYSVVSSAPRAREDNKAQAQQWAHDVLTVVASLSPAVGELLAIQLLRCCEEREH